MPTVNSTTRREDQGTVLPAGLSFHREYCEHTGFLLTITGSESEGAFQHRESAWGNMIAFLCAFMANAAAFPGEVPRAKRDIYMTGGALLSGINIQVIPLP